jgi:Flp pilus assembly protein TadG
MGLRRGAVVRRSHDRGAVAVESALAALVLVVVLLAAAWCLLAVLAQLGVGEAARAGARVAALGEPDAAVAAEAHRLVAGADVDVRRDGDHVIVEVQRSLAPPGPLGRWVSVHLRAQAEALVESAP